MSRSPCPHPLRPLPLSNPPPSHRFPAGLGYGNGGLEAGFFPEVRPQPGAWGAGGEVGGFGLRGARVYDLVFRPPGFPGADGFLNGELGLGD